MSFVQCVGAFVYGEGALYTVNELCIVCESCVYCEGALYIVKELCIVCGSFVYCEKELCIP